MLRILLVSISCILLSFLGFAQNDSTTFLFCGQILDPDSVPVENAYLVSYKTVRGYATDKKGKFKIRVSPDDSLKVVHVSFKPIIIKPVHPDSFRTLILSFEDYTLRTISIKRSGNSDQESAELRNFNRNWNTILTQMQKEGCFCSRGGVMGTAGLAPGGTIVNGLSVTGNPSLGLSPEEIYKQIRLRRHGYRKRKDREPD
jgi:hypothetical protein